MNTTVLADSLIPKFIPEDTKSLRIHFEFEDDRGKMSADEFWEFCRQNAEMRIEMTKEGDVIIMPPTGSETGDETPKSQCS